MENKKYRRAVYNIAEEQGIVFKDIKEKIASSNNAPNALITTYPNQLKKGLKPFLVLGAKVEVKITCDNGSVFDFNF